MNSLIENVPILIALISCSFCIPYACSLFFPSDKKDRTGRVTPDLSVPFGPAVDPHLPVI
jgi:hypothetical protein